jgi:hypothetical protein
MADSFTANLNLRMPEVGAANDTWGGTAGLNNDLQLLDAIFLATGLGTPVGLNIGAGKILNVAGEIQLLDGADPTKVVMFDESLLSTGTTRTFQFPDENGVLATQVDVAVRVPTGTVFSGYYGGVAPPSFVMADGRTIGDASSGALNRANADTVGLFTQLWPLTSLVVSGGRGASAAADYAAHKTLALPNHSGRTMAGRDDLSGTNEGILSPSGIASTTLAAVGGAATESASVSVGGTLSVGVSVSVSGTLGGSITGATATAGSGSGAGALAGVGNPVSVSGSLGGSGSGSASGNLGGNTSAVTNAPPTIIVDVIIAL